MALVGNSHYANKLKVQIRSSACSKLITVLITVTIRNVFKVNFRQNLSIFDRKAILQTLNENIPIILYHCQKQCPLRFHIVILQIIQVK